ncbi:MULTISPECIES: hypothetical protein [unclassified Pseudomonas]|jgi:hypothetical protein|uniref:hypothetical protein n=1 Tax=unclassified Pseudomonas TaxID=196821 RepID=UPI0004855713|nr:MULTISPECIES: hypothetical protein [unclassified Pseudomonas]RAS34260.1 hypothetical protein H040_00391 [Pseudomonas sp. URMO17WK12:I7]SME93087.1 hypothetical protein SAMN02745903_00391 [Pseudomonas sp. URMO17WK12:I5]
MDKDFDGATSRLGVTAGSATCLEGVAKGKARIQADVLEVRDQKVIHTLQHVARLAVQVLAGAQCFSSLPC